ncbi:MAG: hypothetical protein IID44_03855 [Planctomycetes bacterium]|nr:hypothetical protein [Planctomycetota bacterium]
MTLASMIMIGAVTAVHCETETEKKSVEVTIDGTFDMWLEGSEVKFKRTCANFYSVKRFQKDCMLEQYCLDFYDGDRFVGTYNWWNTKGTQLPTSSSGTFLHDIKIKEGWRVVYTSRYYDVVWRDGKRTEKELSHWFEKTFWKFNSVVPQGTKGFKFTLVSSPGMADLATYLQASGFVINATYVFKTEVKQIKQKAKQGAVEPKEPRKKQG